MPDPLVAHVLPWPTVGGVEHGTLRLVQGVGPGVRSIAWCLPGDTAVRALFTAGGIPVREYHGVEPSLRHPLPMLRSARELARSLRAAGVTLVHCSDVLAAFFAAPAARLAGIPVLCHVRCSYPAFSRRDRLFLSLVTHFIFVSEDTRRTFGYPRGAARGTVIHDGIALPPPPRAGVAGRLREELGVPPGSPVVGMVARLAPAKDYDTLIAAAQRVVAVHPEVRFLIVGDYAGAETYRRHFARVLEQVGARGLSANFVFTGHREDVADLLGVFDVFVLSSHTEGLPLVILEAMSHGIPVVATAVGGIPEILQDGVTGYLHPPGDAATLAARLLELLGDRELAGRLGEAGRQHVAAYFGFDQAMERFRQLYRRLGAR